MVSHKSAPKKSKKTESPPDETIDHDMTDLLKPDSTTRPLQENKLALLVKPSRNTGSDSLCYFFSNYVNVPRDHSTNIFVEHILPLYLEAAPDSALAEAIHAVAIDITQMWLARSADTYLARQAYGRAIALLKSSLQDPFECRANETLATVFMLDFYESLNQRFVHFIDTGTHQQGAVALLRHRGNENFKTPLSQRLFNAMRSRHINYCLQTGQRVDLDPDFLAEETAILPSAKLDVLNAELAGISVLARKGPGAAGLGLADFYQLILRKAQALEKKLQVWRSTLPKSWQAVSIPASELHPSIRAAGCYEGMCDVYSSLAVSHVNNSSRSSHVRALRLMSLCVRGLADLGVSVDPDLDPYIDLQAQEIVDRFCASIPYHLGNRTTLMFPHEHCEYPHVPVELRRLANYVDPFGNEVDMTMEDHMRAAAATGAFFIMTPLAGFLKAPSLRSARVKPGPLVDKLRKGQLEWIRGQMSRIQNTYLLQSNHSTSARDSLWVTSSMATVRFHHIGFDGFGLTRPGEIC